MSGSYNPNAPAGTRWGGMSRDEFFGGGATGGVPGGAGATPPPLGSVGPGAAVGGYAGLQNQLLGQMEKMGESRRSAINEAFDKSLDDSLARLSDRGFGNSSGLATIEAGNQRDRQRALTELEDSLLGQRVGVQSTIGLAGLQSADRFRMAQMQPQLNAQAQMLQGLFGGLFG
jgi:hypothetical protein